MTTKQEIFDLFYKLQDAVRSGGGKTKKKMGRCTVTQEAQNAMLLLIGDNAELKAYYIKLLNRDAKSAPPPRPQ